MNQKASFLLYHDQYAPISHLSNEQKGILLDACFKYNLKESFKIADPIVEMAFSFFKQTFIRNNAKYQKRIEQNRKNGMKGGRPKQEKPKNNKKIELEPKPSQLAGLTEEKNQPVRLGCDGNQLQAKKGDSVSEPEPDSQKPPPKKTLLTNSSLIIDTCACARVDVFPEIPENTCPSCGCIVKNSGLCETCEKELAP